MSWTDKEATIPGAPMVIDKHGHYEIQWFTVPPEPDGPFRPVHEEWVMKWPVTVRRIFEWTDAKPTLVREL